ncbi:helix-turn-helix transcriptional regulator [Corticimicrobacter populi]|uniref:Transcriptional regulator n=1 Tax=Corticimicrobacter populi TaxID=2175229 RepID=A0A2V1JXY1_9BURK|nr:AlpA family phage regulatory protein [Corticimicrobacter populi]PWF23342.1 transcriptional regulator [Corticimicrobacter populi]
MTTPRQDNAAGGFQPAFYRMKDVIRITALSRPTLYRRIAAGRFPPPVKLGGRASGWTANALQAWIDNPSGYVAETMEDEPTP